MSTDRLRPIPVPAACRWLEIRRRLLPVAVFAVSAMTAALLWQTTVAPPTLLAEVESIQAEVCSIQGGTLVSLEVDLLQTVSAGTVVGYLVPADPGVLAASLAVIRAEIEYLQASRDPVLPGRRVELDFEDLRLNWMRERVALASLRADLVQAETVFVREEQLHRKNVNTELTYRTAKNLRDGLIAQVREQEELVENLAREMPDPANQNTPAGDAEAALAAAIQVQEEKLRLTEAKLGQIALRAPIDGVVIDVRRRVGESVPAGEPILRIASTESARLIGYARQPLGIEPRAGQTVEIRSRVRTSNRVLAISTIEAVGSVMEPVSPTILMALNRSDYPEMGLRVHIRMPAGHTLLPGECVDVVVREDPT